MNRFLKIALDSIGFIRASEMFKCPKTELELGLRNIEAIENRLSKVKRALESELEELEG